MSNEILDRNSLAQAKEHLAKAITCLQMIGTEPANPGADYFCKLDANRATLGLPIDTPRRDSLGERIVSA